MSVNQRKKNKDRRKRDLGPWPNEERREKTRRANDQRCSGCPGNGAFTFHVEGCPVAKRFS